MSSVGVKEDECIRIRIQWIQIRNIVFKLHGDFQSLQNDTA